MNTILHRFSVKLSSWSGSTVAFFAAILTVFVWLGFGPRYHFSNTWLIAITVITDVVVFVMVFSIQNTQNRTSKAVQLKLNELIMADKKARDTFIGLESLTDEELSEIDDEFKKLFDTLEITPAMRKLHERVHTAKSHRSTSKQNQTERANGLLGYLNGKK